jgi:hypothetical protein
MKQLIATSALALLVGMGAARADQVVIRQNYDLPKRQMQEVENKVKAKADVSGTALEGVNVQNMINWRDGSPDNDLYHGDSYDFHQYTDEEQDVLNKVTSDQGDIQATLSATNLQNIINLEDNEGGSYLRGDKLEADQILGDTLQRSVNEIVAGEEDNRGYGRDDRRPMGSHAVLDGTKAEIANLGNVANVVDHADASGYGRDLVVDLDQKAFGSKQTAENKVRAMSVTGTTLSALNGMNIASFDLADQGTARIDVDQKTKDVTQTISNSIEAGAVTGATLSGTNLGNVVTFKAETTN